MCWNLNSARGGAPNQTTRCLRFCPLPCTSSLPLAPKNKIIMVKRGQRNRKNCQGRLPLSGANVHSSYGRLTFTPGGGGRCCGSCQRQAMRLHLLTMSNHHLHFPRDAARATRGAGVTSSGVDVDQIFGCGRRIYQGRGSCSRRSSGRWEA